MTGLTNNLVLMLADPSACLRYRVLTEIIGYQADHREVAETAALRDSDPVLNNLLKLQNADGSWSTLSSGQTSGFNKYTATSQALRLLAMLGFGPDFVSSKKAADFLFSGMQKNGSWKASEEGMRDEGGKYKSVSLQTSLPLQGLAAAGFAEDSRLDKSWQWLLEQRLPDGAWPSGIAGNVYAYVAGYRRLARSRWGCRSNTSSAVLCLSMHPQLKNTEYLRKGLDHLLARESRDRKALGYDLARLTGRELLKGFFTFYARFDLLLLLEICAEAGVNTEDKRVLELIEFFKMEQTPAGLWIPPSYPDLAPWATLKILSAIKKISENTGWDGFSPSTPFSPYPKEKRRY